MFVVSLFLSVGSMTCARWHAFNPNTYQFTVVTLNLAFLHAATSWMKCGSMTGVEGEGGWAAFSTTLNVSIRPHGGALWKGCEPEPTMHVYLQALAAQWDLVSFSQTVWPKRNETKPTQMLETIHSHVMSEHLGIWQKEILFPLFIIF